MTTLVKRNGDIFPSMLSDFFDTDRFFGTDFPGRRFSTDVPAVNITESEKEFKIEMAAPGMSKKDFKVNLEGDVLTISAEKEEEQKDDNDRYTRREFSYLSFSRSFRLPEEVKAENIDGKYEEGVLKLTIPKKEESMKKATKEIKVS